MIAWQDAWTMDDTVQPLFPVPSCVVFGRRQAKAAAMPAKVRAYSGSLPLRDAPEAIANDCLNVVEGAPALEVAQREGGSAYRSRFRQGAILVPRMLCLVERKVAGRLGSNPSAPLVVSRRSGQEKKPWRDAPSIEHNVEAEFLRPALLGEVHCPVSGFPASRGRCASFRQRRDAERRIGREPRLQRPSRLAQRSRTNVRRSPRNPKGRSPIS